MDRPSVFIGSSSEGLLFAQAVRDLLEQEAEVTLWNEGFFELGSTFIETLVNSLATFDFAVLVLTGDDLVHSRNDEMLGPRDNVIFELGLFTGRLGRSRTFIVHQANAQIKLPTDLSGVTMAGYSWPRTDGNHMRAVGAACDAIRRVIRELGFSEEKSSKQVRVLEGKVDREIERVEVKQTEQGQDIKLLRFFIANFIGKFELMHLEGLEKGRPYPFDYVRPEFEQELVHLRSSGLINHFEGKGIVAMKREGKGDLHDHFYITNLGREYLKLRRQVESEAETEAAKAKP
jgi:hypothetical protein